ncbi:MAG: thiamine diphosphokinase [Bacteroidales bacterium]|nr:thiamine diphosphokinase [Bacteroidales bacterium]
MEKRKPEKIVILAAGDFPSHPVPLGALHDADFVVCCDSAYSQLTSSHVSLSIPFVVIGDGDSLSASEKDALAERYIQVDEQDYNDLHKAMQWAVAKFGILDSQFTILGATGRREDHTLGNISYLVTFAEEYPGADITMLTDYGTLRALAAGEYCLPCFPRQQISLFVPDPATRLYSRGLRWPLDGNQPKRWWQATLNEALEDNFTLRCSGWVILFSTFEPKG